MLYALAACFLMGTVFLFARLLTPGDRTGPRVLTAADEAVLDALRDYGIDPQNPPVRWLDVDYTEGPAAAWWPRTEPVLLQPLVDAGRLPPVVERTGVEPLVLDAGTDLEPESGGTWYRAALSLSDVNVMMLRLSAATLVRWSPQGYPIVPHIARAWEISDDYRIFTFHLRRGARWSDGAPLTTDDIRYWWEMESVHPQMRSTAPLLMRIGDQSGHVEIVDRWTFRFVFPEPNALFLEKLASFAGTTVLNSPAHYLAPLHPFDGNPELIAAEMNRLRMPSPRALYTAVRERHNPAHPRLWPWIFSSPQTTPPYTAVRNPYYFAVDAAGQQLPYVDRVFFNQQSGDLIGVSAGAGEFSLQDRNLRFQQYTLLMDGRASGGYEIYHWLNGDSSSYVIQPNILRRVEPNRPETRWKRQYLEMAEFRRALSLAINRPDILRAEFAGMSQPSQVGPPPQSAFFHRAVMESWTQYDPARAAALLDSIGLEQRDSDGYRTFPDGTRMQFFIHVTPMFGVGPAQLVAEDWRSVGVRVQVRERSRELFRLEIDSMAHDFSVWMSNGEFLPLLEPRLILPFNTYSDFARAWGVWFLGGGYHTAADAPTPLGGQRPPDGHPVWQSYALYEQLTRTSNREEQVNLVHSLLDIALDQVWTINLGTAPPTLAVVRNDFHNVPRKAVYSYDFLSPGNYAPETFFVRGNPDPPVTVERLRADLMVESRQAAIGGAVAGESLAGVTDLSTSRPLLGRIVRVGFLLIAVLVVVLVTLRHPFVGRRLLLMIPTLLVVSIVNFVIIQAPPGDYLTTLINQLQESGDDADLQRVADLQEIFHLDDSKFSRYLRWSGVYWFGTLRAEDRGLLQGHMGRSMETLETVNDVVGDRILLTLLISFGTILFTWVVALPLGIYSAVRQYSPGDYIAGLVGFIGMCIPNFLLALILMYFSSRYLGITAIGLFSPEYAARPDWTWGKFVDLLQHIWIPVVVVGTGGTAHMLRIMRGNLLDELKKPYVTTARAKGVRPLRLLLKYPVRLALNPFVSGIGNIFPQLVSGSAIVALILSLPTVGPLMLSALLSQDMYLAGSLLMVLSIMGVLGTLISDLLLVLLDPRIRLEQGSSR
jgi:ABC-type dipeptide/oligopeptide/nickel transport system permease component/ABC-type transport system substrate-binding protein